MLTVTTLSESLRNGVDTHTHTCIHVCIRTYRQIYIRTYVRKGNSVTVRVCQLAVFSSWLHWERKSMCLVIVESKDAIQSGMLSLR